jgi:hypothetical protein
MGGASGWRRQPAVTAAFAIKARTTQTHAVVGKPAGGWMRLTDAIGSAIDF